MQYTSKNPLRKLEAAKVQIQKLPEALLLDVVGKYYGKDIEVFNKKAVFNVGYGKVSKVVSDKYKLIQHKDFFHLCIGCAHVFDPDFFFKLKRDKTGDGCIMDVWYKHRKISDDTKAGLCLGFRFDNTYSLRRPATLTMGAYREYNKSFLQLGIGDDYIFKQRSIGNLNDVKEKLVMDFNKIIHAQNEVAAKVQLAMNTPIKFEDIMPKLFPKEWSHFNFAASLKQQGMLEMIMDNALVEAGTSPLNAWNLFCSISLYAKTHSRCIEKELYLNDRAQRIFNFL